MWHLFSNHILKPEKTPLENNVWGTAKSSGAFSSLYASRLLRAKEYLFKPYEIRRSNPAGRLSKGRSSSRIYGAPIGGQVTDNYQIFKENGCTSLVLNGDSGELPIPDASVDAVVTDPPYFDFVHYSELSDFFFAWLAPVLSSDYPYFDKENCGDKREVQHKSVQIFALNLGRVFKESYRTLKDDGLLIFSFHHSKATGWLAIYQAIVKAGFEIVAAHPVKAEMSVAKPKSAARSPINLDAILVCKKGSLPRASGQAFGEAMDSGQLWKQAYKRSDDYFKRFYQAQRKLTLGDKRVIMASQVLVVGSNSGLTDTSIEELLNRTFSDKLSEANDTPTEQVAVHEPKAVKSHAQSPSVMQMRLFD